MGSAGRLSLSPRLTPACSASASSADLHAVAAQVDDAARTGREIMRPYEARGVQFTLNRRGRVLVSPAALVDDSDRESLRAFRPEIIAALQARPARRRRAVPAVETLARRVRATVEHRDAQESYRQLRDAIRAEGGIRSNRDYATGEIPRELRRRPGRGGLFPDEMAQVLSYQGFGYEGDVGLFSDIERRKARVRETHEAYRAAAPRTRGEQTVCSDVCRNERGLFASCHRAGRHAVRQCRGVLRDAIGRFRRGRRSA